MFKKTIAFWMILKHWCVKSTFAVDYAVAKCHFEGSKLKKKKIVFGKVLEEKYILKNLQNERKNELGK
jgi:hypothetical protein